MNDALIARNSSELVYIVDDEAAVCQAMEMLLTAEGLAVRAFTAAREFLEICNQDLAGCVLLDLYMPGLSGLEVQNELRRRDVQIPIIFLSGCGNVPCSAQAFREGAFDFLEKPFDSEALLTRVQEALARDRAMRARRRIRSETSALYHRLSEREKQILHFVAKGHSSKEAAKALAISHRTVEVHRVRIMEKMRAESLADLIRMALTVEELAHAHQSAHPDGNHYG